MKKKEPSGCIEQAERLFAERLYTGGAVPVDENRLIRIDDLELDQKFKTTCQNACLLSLKKIFLKLVI